MKKTSTKKDMQPEPKPEVRWQTGAYDRYAEYSFILPYQFLLLCKLVNITPRELIVDFMENLSCGHWNREGRDQAKEHLVNYFIAHGYGRQHYNEKDMREMFKEMDALGLLFPKEGKNKLLYLHADWRDKYRKYWFKKWCRKGKEKLSKKEML